MLRYFGATVTLFVVLATGCSNPPPNGPRFKTSPLTGTVHVDGVPAAFLDVECHPITSEIKYPVTTVTDDKGNFSLGTYQAKDGLPAGSYTLVFKWLEPGLVRTDKLKGAYGAPEKSTHKITVEIGKKNELGVIELSTKGPS